MAAITVVVVLFEAEGVDGHGRARAVGRAAQDTAAQGVVGVEFDALGASIPTDEVIQEIVSQRSGGATGGAAGDVAPTVVAAAVDQGGFVGAGGSAAVDAGQFVWLAGAVEILLLRTGAIHRPFPELAEVGVDVRVVVVDSVQGVGEGGTPTGAVTCSWLGPGVACPDQAVLFVVAEVLALTATGATFIGHDGLGDRRTDDIVGRVIGEVLREDGATGAAATLPGGAGTQRAQDAAKVACPIWRGQLEKGQQWHLASCLPYI